jgi:hypothetical protein
VKLGHSKIKFKYFYTRDKTRYTNISDTITKGFMKNITLIYFLCQCSCEKITFFLHITLKFNGLFLGINLVCVFLQQF